MENLQNEPEDIFILIDELLYLRFFSGIITGLMIGAFSCALIVKFYFWLYNLKIVSVL